MNILGLDHVKLAIPLGGETAARRFYGELLKMRELPKPSPLDTQGGCWFEGEDIILHIDAEKEFVPATKAHPSFLVSDLETLRRAFSGAGIVMDSDGALPDARRLHAADPFGNRLEFIQVGGHAPAKTGNGASQGVWLEKLESDEAARSVHTRTALKILRLFTFLALGGALFFLNRAVQTSRTASALRRSGVKTEASVVSVLPVRMPRGRSYYMVYDTEFSYAGPDGHLIHQSRRMTENFSNQRLPILYEPDQPTEFLTESDMATVKSEVVAHGFIGFLMLGASGMVFYRIRRDHRQNEETLRQLTERKSSSD